MLGKEENLKFNFPLVPLQTKKRWYMPLHEIQSELNTIFKEYSGVDVVCECYRAEGL